MEAGALAPPPNPIQKVGDGRFEIAMRMTGVFGKPVSVLWRRMDASFTDPLELRTDSRIGTPGMVEALRQGSISMVNAIGSALMPLLKQFAIKIIDAVLTVRNFIREHKELVVTIFQVAAAVGR